MLRVEDNVGINKSFRRMYKKGNVRPRNASERRRGIDEAFMEECSQYVLLGEPPKKIKESRRVPTKGIEKEWIASETDKFKEAKSKGLEKRNRRREEKSKSEPNKPPMPCSAIAGVLEKPKEQESQNQQDPDPTQMSSSTTSELLEKPEKQEFRILQDPGPTGEETYERVREWLDEVAKTEPEVFYDDFVDFE
ncbi:hypothetical protein GCK72_022337 [Caenorhabditis remanei]|uniref:Uncharacterized protein n=1 Tax=Caenorhabditis remanei TaxID=31234 RepID=A0A6A5FTH2_CAERE|nr:hypothetical protein GCK72_022337 [Caenorhabditis remanei]KAF1745890.1 hypothetical protein GCK72_022337 [Caenorhabditis remanei]